MVKVISTRSLGDDCRECYYDPQVDGLPSDLDDSPEGEIRRLKAKPIQTMEQLPPAPIVKVTGGYEVKSD